MSRRAVVNIDLAALSQNVKIIRAQLKPSVQIMAMIKANAYGHGALKIAQHLQTLGVERLAVATLNEALELREQGITLPLLVTTGIQTSKDIFAFMQARLCTLIYDKTQLQLVADFSAAHPHFNRATSASTEFLLSVWLKLDTGMGRLGFNQADAKIAYQSLQNCAWVQKPIGLMTHFLASNERSNPITKIQCERFAAWTSTFQGSKSLANSAAILSSPATHADCVRPGIILYGISPFTDREDHASELEPLMTLLAPLVSVKTLQAGDTVGYGGTWTCPETMSVGILGIGYGDGYPRHAPSGTPILVNGVRCALIGRVSMDFIAVDLRACLQAKVGDHAILWGKGLPVEEIAKWVGTIPYELVTRIGPRVQYQYI